MNEPWSTGPRVSSRIYDCFGQEVGGVTIAFSNPGTPEEGRMAALRQKRIIDCVNAMREKKPKELPLLLSSCDLIKGHAKVDENVVIIPRLLWDLFTEDLGNLNE